MKMRQVHTKQRVSAPEVIDHASRNKLPDVLLRFFRAPPNMRRQNHVGQSLPHARKPPSSLRFLRKHIDRRSPEFPALQMPRQGVMIHHKPTAKIDQASALFHGLEFIFSK